MVFRRNEDGLWRNADWQAGSSVHSLRGSIPALLLLCLAGAPTSPLAGANTTQSAQLGNDPARSHGAQDTQLSRSACRPAFQPAGQPFQAMCRSTAPFTATALGHAFATPDKPQTPSPICFRSRWEASPASYKGRLALENSYRRCLPTGWSESAGHRKGDETTTKPEHVTHSVL